MQVIEHELHQEYSGSLSFVVFLGSQSTQQRLHTRWISDVQEAPHTAVHC